VQTPSSHHKTRHHYRIRNTETGNFLTRARELQFFRSYKGTHALDGAVPTALTKPISVVFSSTSKPQRRISAATELEPSAVPML
jgi:hypothetical protein